MCTYCTTVNGIFIGTGQNRTGAISHSATEIFRRIFRESSSVNVDALLSTVENERNRLSEIVIEEFQMSVDLKLMLFFRCSCK